MEREIRLEIEELEERIAPGVVVVVASPFGTSPEGFPRTVGPDGPSLPAGAVAVSPVGSSGLGSVPTTGVTVTLT